MKQLLITTAEDTHEMAEELVKLPAGNHILVGISQPGEPGFVEVDWIPYDDIREIKFLAHQEIKVKHRELDGRTESLFDRVLFIGDIEQWCKDLKIKFTFKPE